MAQAGFIVTCNWKRQMEHGDGDGPVHDGCMQLGTLAKYVRRQLEYNVAILITKERQLE